MRRMTVFSIFLLAASALPVLAGDSEAGASVPTFNRDIAPIIYNNCSNCHRTGEVAPFALLTYNDAAKRAKQIAAITQARVMPPWKAEPGYGHFLNERRLTDQQIAAIREWATNGAPEGDPNQKPEPPKFSNGWQAGEPDQVVGMSQPYSLPAEGPDQFRCFVIPLNATEEEYVTQVEFRPGNRRVVHHSILFLDTTGQARRREKVPGEGYDCVGGPGLAISGGLGGWAPGASPTQFENGIAQIVPKGADLVMQLHYHLDGKAEEDQSRVGIKFSKTPPVRGLTLLTVGNTNIDIPAGDNHYVVKASATLPMDSQVIGVFPHAHYLCKDMQVTAKLPDGTVEPLIWIRDWDFNWQGAYRYQSPLKLPKGTEIDMQYTYDNSADNVRNPSNPPREVKFGEQTTNEMAFAFVQVTLDSPALVADFQRDANAQFIAWVIDGVLHSDELGPRQKAQMQMLLGLFDKNKNGHLDDDERPAMIEFLKKMPPLQR
jgi:mono/diheme cytochrome c family protein